MNSDSTVKSDLRKRLLHEFGSVPIPDKRLLLEIAEEYPSDVGPFSAHFSTWSHWQQVPITLIQDNPSALCAFRADALIFFLPAYLWQGLGDSIAANTILGRALDGMALMGLLNEDSADQALLTSGQVALIMDITLYGVENPRVVVERFTKDLAIKIIQGRKGLPNNRLR